MDERKKLAGSLAQLDQAQNFSRTYAQAQKFEKKGKVGGVPWYCAKT